MRKALLSAVLAVPLVGCLTTGQIQPLLPNQAIAVPVPVQPNHLSIMVMWDVVGLIPFADLIAMSERNEIAENLEMEFEGRQFRFPERLQAILIEQLVGRGQAPRPLPRDEKRLITKFSPLDELEGGDAQFILDVVINWYGFYAHHTGEGYIPAAAIRYRLVDVNQKKEIWTRALRYNFDGGAPKGVTLLQETPDVTWPDRFELLKDPTGTRMALEKAAGTIATAIVEQVSIR